MPHHDDDDGARRTTMRMQRVVVALAVYAIGSLAVAASRLQYQLRLPRHASLPYTVLGEALALYHFSFRMTRQTQT